MKVLWAMIAVLFFAGAVHAQAACPPAGYDLVALKQHAWEMASDRRRNAFARALVPCLASTDPALRDGAAFEALQRMMRTDRLSAQTLLTLEAELRPWLTAPEGGGFARPFAALTLSEIARVDRIRGFLPTERRAALIDAATDYLTNVRDYRGFDAHEGWRHGVAHGADLMLQLSLNPALGKLELTRIRDAVGSQIAPPDHFYIYGESERLARPILFMAQRGMFTQDEWTAWLMRLPTRAEDAFASQTGLAWRHDVMAFLSALYLNVRSSENTQDDAMAQGLDAALRAMP